MNAHIFGVNFWCSCSAYIVIRRIAFRNSPHKNMLRYRVKAWTRFIHAMQRIVLYTYDSQAELSRNWKRFLWVVARGGGGGIYAFCHTCT